MKLVRMYLVPLLLAAFAITQTGWVHANQENDIVRFSLQLETPSGSPISEYSSVQVGQEFILVVNVRDLRENPSGISQAFVDITYDSDLVERASGFIRTSTDFPFLPRGMWDDDAGIIFNVGGTDPSASPSLKADHEVVRIKFRAKTTAGHIRFQTRPVVVDDPTIDHSTILYGPPPTIPQRCESEFHGISLRHSPADFNFDKRIDVDDVNMMLGIGDLKVGVPVNPGNAIFNLIGPYFVNTDDLMVWLAEAGIENNLDSPYLPGDANLDGCVNGPDFTILSSNFGSPSSNWSDGNFDEVPGVGGGDFTKLATNFGDGSDFECD